MFRQISSQTKLIHFLSSHVNVFIFVMDNIAHTVLLSRQRYVENQKYIHLTLSCWNIKKYESGDSISVHALEGLKHGTHQGKYMLKNQA